MPWFSHCLFFRLWTTLMRWNWRRSCSVVSTRMVLSVRLQFSNVRSYRVLWAMMWLLKPNLVLARQPPLPFRFCSKSTSKLTNVKHLCWLPRASWLSRFRRYYSFDWSISIEPLLSHWLSGCVGPWWLHGCSMPRLYWWNQRAWRSP